MSAGSDVALSVSLMLYHLPAQLVLHLDVARGVLVGAPAVLQDVTTLSDRVELPDLYFPLN